MKTGHYDGPAQIIHTTGTIDATITAYATLDEHLGDWGGTADIAHEATAATLMAGESRLRMPDGREADIVITGYTIGSGPLEFQGSASPPFDLD